MRLPCGVRDARATRARSPDTPAQVNRPRHDRCPAHRPVGGPRKSRRGEQYEWGQGDVIERTPGRPNPERGRRQTHDNPADTRHSESRSMPKGEQCQPVTKLVGNNKDDGDHDNHDHIGQAEAAS